MSYGLAVSAVVAFSLTLALMCTLLFYAVMYTWRNGLRNALENYAVWWSLRLGAVLVNKESWPGVRACGCDADVIAVVESPRLVEAGVYPEIVVGWICTKCLQPTVKPDYNIWQNVFPGLASDESGYPCEHKNGTHVARGELASCGACGDAYGDDQHRHAPSIGTERVYKA